MTTVLRVTKDTFEQEVLKSDKPVVVDFYADWCPPCKALAPRLEQAAGERADSVKFVKVDVDADKEISQSYGVRAMPTLMIFKDGKIVESRAGALSKSSLDAWIDAGIAKPASEGKTPAEIKAAAPSAKEEKLTDEELKEALKEADRAIGKSGLRGLVAAITVPFAILPAVAGGIVLAAGATALPAVAAVGAIGASVYRLYNLGKILQPGALEKSFDGLKRLLNEKEKGEAPKKPKKDGKYFTHASIKLGISLAKLGTSVALFAVAAPMTGFAAFGATTLAVWMALQGGFGTLARVPMMIRDVKEKIEHSFLKDLPPEEKPVALPAPQNAAPAPAVSTAEAGKDFAAAAKAADGNAKPAVNDNAQEAKPEAKPAIKPPAA